MPRGSPSWKACRRCEHLFQVRADGYAAQTVAVAATAPGLPPSCGFALCTWRPASRHRVVPRKRSAACPVGLTLQDGWFVWHCRRRFDAVTTDVQGRFQFDNLPLDKTLTISVERSNRLLQKNVLLSADEKNVTADFAFDKQPESGSILVHVTGSDHQPIAEARLSNRGISPHCAERHNRCERHCRIDDVVSLFGRYLLAVRVNGFAPDIRDFKAGPRRDRTGSKSALEKGHTLREMRDAHHRPARR